MSKIKSNILEERNQNINKTISTNTDKLFQGKDTKINIIYKNDTNYCISNEKSTKTSTIEDKKPSKKQSMRRINDSEDSFADEKMHFYHVEKKFKLNYIKPIKPKNNNYQTMNKIKNNTINSQILLNKKENKENSNYNKDELSGIFSDSSSENKNLIISKLDIDVDNQENINKNVVNINNNIKKDYKKEFELNIKRFLKKNQEDKKKLNERINVRRQSDIYPLKQNINKEDKILTQRNEMTHKKYSSIKINKEIIDKNSKKQIKKKPSKNVGNKPDDNNKINKKKFVIVGSKKLLNSNNSNNNKIVSENKIKGKIVKKIPKLNKEGSKIYNKDKNSKK